VAYSPLHDPDLPGYLIRPMTLPDLEIVRQIDRDAFETYRRNQHQLSRPLHLRTPANMEAAFRRPNPGIVIEWPPGKVAGYCFTHIWGSLGWLGTLGVNPHSQGFGLGRGVIAGGLDVLRQAGCRVLALETMPESGKNLALYTRLGLDARQLTCLCQGTPPLAPSTDYEIWQDDNDDLLTISSSLIPGLDPTPAARWLIKEEAGETLVWYNEQGDPAAFAALRTIPRRISGTQFYVSVDAAACLPEAAANWPRYLSEIQTYGHRMGKMGVVLPINARQSTLLRYSLDAGMQIVHTRVRMVTGESLGAPDDTLMLTLAM
jgi:predicted N-acetyltransferase YhbS